MPGPDFLDTNVLVYAYDSLSPGKQRVARDLVHKAILGESVISTQVLAEFATILLHKISPPPKPEAIAAALDALDPIKAIVPDGDMVRRAVEVHANYGLHFYDGMIVAAAERAGCPRILSEDLDAGQKYFGVTVVNPFR